MYERVLAYELQKLGCKVDVQKLISLVHDELFISTAFRADMMVEDCVMVELKSVEELLKLYYKQVITI